MDSDEVLDEVLFSKKKTLKKVIKRPSKYEKTDVPASLRNQGKKAVKTQEQEAQGGCQEVKWQY